MSDRVQTVGFWAVFLGLLGVLALVLVLTAGAAWRERPVRCDVSARLPGGQTVFLESVSLDCGEMSCVAEDRDGRRWVFPAVDCWGFPPGSVRAGKPAVPPVGPAVTP